MPSLSLCASHVRVPWMHHVRMCVCMYWRILALPSCRNKSSEVRCQDPDLLLVMRQCGRPTKRRMGQAANPGLSMEMQYYSSLSTEMLLTLGDEALPSIATWGAGVRTFPFISGRVRGGDGGGMMTDDDRESSPELELR